MTAPMRRLLVICAVALTSIAIQAQEKEQPPIIPQTNDIRNMGMPASQTNDSHESMTSADENVVHAMNNMQGHMDSGAHMKMTPLRLATPGDSDRAQSGRTISGLPQSIGRRIRHFPSQRPSTDVPLHQLPLCNGSDF